MRARGVPTGTVCSGWTSSSATSPEAGAGTSQSILSVVISQIVSSASTRSPGCLCQSTSVPSVTETPIWGIVTSTSSGAPAESAGSAPRSAAALSVGEELAAGLPDVVDLWQHRPFERRREGDRDVARRDPHDRAVEVLEAPLGDQRGHLRSGGARGVRLVDDDHL